MKAVVLSIKPTYVEWCKVMSKKINEFIVRGLRSLGYLKYGIPEINEGVNGVFEVRGYAISFRGDSIRNFVLDVTVDDTFFQVQKELMDRIGMNHSQCFFGV